MDFDDILQQATPEPTVSEEGNINLVDVSDDGNIKFQPHSSTGIEVEDELRDMDGRTFNPLIHQTDDNGEPITYKTGVKKGKLKVKRSKAATESLSSSTDQVTSLLVTQTFLKTAMIFIGEFDVTRDEFGELNKATEDYLATTETNFEPPPWMVLLSAFGLFTAKKMTENSEKEEKTGLIQRWLRSRKEKKEKKREEKKVDNEIKEEKRENAS